jgi:hypothetical protein
MALTSATVVTFVFLSALSASQNRFAADKLSVAGASFGAATSHPWTAAMLFDNAR